MNNSKNIKHSSKKGKDRSKINVTRKKKALKFAGQKTTELEEMSGSADEIFSKNNYEKPFDFITQSKINKSRKSLFETSDEDTDKADSAVNSSTPSSQPHNPLFPVTPTKVSHIPVSYSSTTSALHLTSPVKSPSSVPQSPLKAADSGVFSSPSPNKMRKLSTSSTIDQHGYVMSFHVEKSRSGNEFIDVNLKVSPKELVVVRIMKQSNQNITTSYLSELKLTGVPVAFTKLSETNNGLFFFNSYRGSRIQSSNEVSFTFSNSETIFISDIKQQVAGTFDIVGCIKWLSDVKESPKTQTKFRECILFDSTDHIRLTIWGEEIYDDLEEVHWYSFTNLMLKNYFGMKLNTTKSSVVTSINSESSIPELKETDFRSYVEQDQNIQEKMRPTLCCPEIINVEVEICSACTNCAQPVTIVPGCKIVNCIHCSRTMRADRCNRLFKCVLAFENISLSLPIDVISSFTNMNVMALCESNMEKFKEQLLYLEHTDYVYTKKNIIIEMKSHEQ